MNDREDFNTPQYKTWRFAVLKRDDFTCQLTKRKLQMNEAEAHHIIPWAQNPNLRYVVSNGVTLSKEAHELVTGREDQFREQFQRIVASKITKKGRKLKGQGQKLYQRKWKPRNPNNRYGG